MNKQHTLFRSWDLSATSLNLSWKALFTTAYSLLPRLLRDGKKAESIPVSPKAPSLYQSFTDQDPGKLKITSEEPLFSRNSLSGYLWAAMASEKALLISSSVTILNYFWVFFFFEFRCFGLLCFALLCFLPSIWQRYKMTSLKEMPLTYVGYCRVNNVWKVEIGSKWCPFWSLESSWLHWLFIQLTLPCFIVWTLVDSVASRDQ